MVHLVMHVEENEEMLVPLIKDQVVENERILVALLKDQLAKNNDGKNRVSYSKDDMD